MGCCSVRILSYISASLQLVCCVLMLLLAILAGVAANSEQIKRIDEGGIFADTATIIVIIGAVACTIAIALLVTLIVGIQQRRLLLVSIYVYTTYVILVLCVILIIAEVVMDILNEDTIGTVLLDLFINLFVLGLEILCFVPILILHMRMRAPPILPTTYNGPVTTENKEV